MDVERSSLCNCVVNFLIEENYLLSAFELLHELLDDGRDDQAIRLKEFFSDPAQFPSHQISRFNSLRVADPQSLLEEKESLEEKLAVNDYELRLAQEDIAKLKAELLKKAESNLDESTRENEDSSKTNGSIIQPVKREVSSSELGPLKDNERFDINCAVKEYLLLAGYRLTAMTFYEEVTDQNLDVWQNSSACVPDALRHYYYQYLCSSTGAAEERITMLQENESLVKENEKLKNNNNSLLKSKGMIDAQVTALTKSLEVLQKDVKDKEMLVQSLKRTSESQREELNDCRAEITSLKMHIEGSRSQKNLSAADSAKFLPPENHNEETKRSHNETEMEKAKIFANAESVESIKLEDVNEGKLYQIEEPPVGDVTDESLVGSSAGLETSDAQVIGEPRSTDTSIVSDKVPELLPCSVDNECVGNGEAFLKSSTSPSSENDSLITKSGNLDFESNAEKMASSGSSSKNAKFDDMKKFCIRLTSTTFTTFQGLGTIQIVSDALPKIVPYVLINHREELLPLIMCSIERHPDSTTRDSLTHTLFNLIKRPDEQQRRIIMDACVTLAKNVGELRTETELLPQCWEQINHIYEERRLLVAQSCGELADYVRPEIRDSLILSIVQQLIEDSATVVREAAARNLALLLPLFPNTDKYFKVEEMMFQLVCDPSGIVVETTIKELVPALVNWGNKLDHILEVLLSHILASAQNCAPLSGVESSIESYLRVLGERERWNIDVLLRLLVDLLPRVHQKAIETCPVPSESSSAGVSFTLSLLEKYAGGNVEWPEFEWLHDKCFPSLIQLTSLLPHKEDNLRNRLTKLLSVVAEYFGEPYLTHIMLPVFLLAVGDNADLKFFPFTAETKLRGLRPQTAMAQKLATMCVLPLLLAGVLGHPSKREYLTEYLRTLLIQGSGQEGQPAKHEIVNSVRFICTFEEHHNMIFNILWEMVVSSAANLKISAAHLLKVIVPYVDAKIASTHVLPALVTLGSDQNLSVKYASIDTFGAVAQHFKNDMIVDKIRVQMDAFLEDGSHEATIAVVRALVVAVPHTTGRLRDYLLSKIFYFTASPPPSSDVARRRERADAFCESIRALDATDLTASSVRDFLLPAIQNLLKDTDALDPAHKEALEIILKERSGGTFDAISKVMGGHLGLPTSVSSFFGENSLLGKREGGDPGTTQFETLESLKPVPPPPVEDTRFRRIMRGGFTDMLRGKTKGSDETPPSQ